MTEDQVLSIYAPAAKSGKSWEEIMKLFPEGTKQESLAVKISGIRKKKRDKMLAQIEEVRKSGRVVTQEQIDKLEEKLVLDKVPLIQSRARTKNDDGFADEFAEAFSALDSLTGQEG